MSKKEFEDKLDSIKEESKACIILAKTENSNCVVVEGLKDDLKDIIYNLLDSSKSFESFLSEILAERAVRIMKEKHGKLGEMLEEIRNEIKNKVLN